MTRIRLLTDEHFLSVTADGRELLYLYDFGPGASLRLSAVVSIRRRCDCKCEARGKVNFTLTSRTSARGR